MIQQLQSLELLYSDFVPQAEIVFPLDVMDRRFRLVQASDDLHDFIGAAFVVDGRLPFVIKHYLGTDSDSFTIYFHKESNMNLVSKNVDQIMLNLEIPRSALRWERSNDPEA